ncbi:MAG: response regulator [Candidatus Nitrohelix vancouverensis]|uniref:Response regulator n=1 Tax=Candidatus Nitrohelix vancouverensis TaxID=2705534 RepID=A0A7T0C446_9BACT|nr:MAG: response regulator [Candidatus Nitrohelix vancouverensis]
MEALETVEVLLIEDREEDATMAIRGLKKYNVANHIKWVEDGEEALNYLTANPVPPKLILLDLKMPKLSGLEVLKLIRKMARIAKTPIVVMSSSNEDSDIEESYALGANSYIVKPVDFEKFTDTIKKLGFYWLMINEPPKGKGFDEDTLS